jgi:predicted aspartyl protease
LASQFFAYTFYVPKPFNSIVIPIELGVSLPVPQTMPGQKMKVKTTALVDTGATGSCISEKFARHFGLKAFSMSKVHTAKGEDVRPCYYLDIFLPNGLMYKNMEVIEFTENAGTGFDFIIGMNIIRAGDMSITNANNQMVFSFRMPPNHLHIDYEKLKEE